MHGDGQLAAGAAGGLVRIVHRIETDERLDGPARLVEWRTTGVADGRVGVVHAAVNGLAAACYARSMVPRGRGQGIRAAGWSVAGGLAATAGGYFGGHLSIARKVGSRDAALAGSPARPPVAAPVA